MAQKQNKAVSQQALKEKEKNLQNLAETLKERGVIVRREKLKQGPGWKTVSGVCDVEGRKFAFVDRKNPLDDQILFLQSLLVQLDTQTAA